MFVYFVVVVCVLCLLNAANAQYSVVTPQFNGGDYVVSYSGGTFEIEADNSNTSPLNYDSSLYGCSFGLDSPYQTFPFNQLSNFSVPDNVRGVCNVDFSESGTSFGTGAVEILAGINITSNTTRVEAGTDFIYNATTVYTDISNPISAQIICDSGTLNTLVNVNTGVEQTISIPIDYLGNCTMTATQGEIDSYFFIFPYEFEVYSVITIQVLPPTEVPPGATVGLLIFAASGAQVTATLTTNCTVGASQSQQITTAANSTDYTYVTLGQDVRGTCEFSLSDYDPLYETEPAYITILYNELVIEVLSPAPIYPGTIVQLLVHDDHYTPVSLTLTLTCQLGGSVSQNIVSASSSTDYTYFQIGGQQGNECLFTESNYPGGFVPSTAQIQLRPNPRLYYFPYERRVSFKTE